MHALLQCPAENIWDFVFGRYPKALDSVLEEHLESAMDRANQDIFHQFISLSLSCGKYKVSRSLIPHPTSYLDILSEQWCRGKVLISLPLFKLFLFLNSISAIPTKAHDLTEMGEGGWLKMW